MGIAEERGKKRERKDKDQKHKTRCGKGTKERIPNKGTRRRDRQAGEDSNNIKPARETKRKRKARKKRSLKRGVTYFRRME